MPNKTKVEKPHKTFRYRKRHKGASIYFLLWTTFSALALVIVITLGILFRVTMRNTYKLEAERDLNQKGSKIEQMIEAPIPAEFKGNMSVYIRFLGNYFDVHISILNADGEIIFPETPNLEKPEIADQFDYSKKIITLKEHLKTSTDGSALYEGKGEYVYGAKISLYGNSERYLYLSKSLKLMEIADAELGAKFWMVGGFVFILSFAIGSAIAGWLTKPIAELTEKAQRLAEGDFHVDFLGPDYVKELEELAQSLNFAKDEISKSDRMQKELIANVSHDFKTPLTMIKGYASMIIEISGENKQKREKHAQIIIDETDRLTSLVSDVLDLSKISSGLDQLKKEKVCLSTYLEEVIGRFDYLNEMENYTFHLDIEKDLYAEVDQLKVGQVFYNLIGNAVNYTGEDKQIYISLNQIENYVRFAVRDTGDGIKPEEAEGIWQRYYRSTQNHKRPIKGTGLGLSIVKAILEKHHLDYGVESETGKGSTFFVHFPVFDTKE